MDDQKSSVFQAFTQKRSFLALIAVTVVLTLVFRQFPDIDIAVSGLFHENGRFPWAGSEILRTMRRFSIDVTKCLVIIILLLWLYRILSAERNNFLSFARLGFSTTCLLTGPVLLTNLILKDNWGRPRPRHIEEFGGQDTFVLPWSISDQCASNCSFVSGETSSAIWLLTLIPFVPVAWHNRAVILVFVYAGVISFLRIAFGAHFLSDVIFSILLNSLVFWIIWGLFFRRREFFITRDWSEEGQAVHYFCRIFHMFRCMFLLVFSWLCLPIRRR